MASIQKRGDRYSVVYEYFDDLGKKKQKWEAYNTEAEATKRKLEIEYKQQHNRFISPNDITVREFFEKWLPMHARKFWSPKTYDTGYGMILNHVYPHIGDLPLQSLTKEKMDIYFDTLCCKKKGSYKRGMPNPKCKSTKYLSGTTLKDVYIILNSAFNKAVEWKLIEENPLPSEAPKRDTSERLIWTEELVRNALEEIDDPLLHLAVHLAFIGSLRNGETVAITLDCLLPEEEAIVIDKTLERVSKASLEKLHSAEVYKVFPNKIADKKSCLILKPPKTTSSRRKAFFNSEIFREIDLRLAEIERNKQTLMSRYNDHNLLICRENGDPIEPQRLMDMFADWQDAHGTNYPRIVFHGLRHSATTYKMSISNGDVKSVQGDNGHSSADMTLNCYSHVEELRRKTLAKKVESSFYKTAREPEDKTEDESVDKLIEMALGNPQFQKKVLLALLSNTA